MGKELDNTAKATVHLSRGNRYRGHENLFCSDSRVILVEGESSTFSYKKTTCVLCLRQFLKDLKVKEAYVREEIEILAKGGDMGGPKSASSV